MVLTILTFLHNLDAVYEAAKTFGVIILPTPGFAPLKSVVASPGISKIVNSGKFPPYKMSEIVPVFIVRWPSAKSLRSRGQAVQRRQSKTETITGFLR